MGCSQAQVYPTIKMDHFPTEKEVNDFLKVGLDKQVVVAKFGEPLVKTPQPSGSEIDEIYYYPEPPDKIPKEEDFVYAGFQVYFTKNKVSGFRISHRTVHIPPK
jgi:hypothetical protein